MSQINKKAAPSKANPHPGPSTTSYSPSGLLKLDEGLALAKQLGGRHSRAAAQHSSGERLPFQVFKHPSPRTKTTVGARGGFSVSCTRDFGRGSVFAIRLAQKRKE